MKQEEVRTGSIHIIRMHRQRLQKPGRNIFREKETNQHITNTHTRTQTLNCPNLVKRQTDDVLQTPYLTHRGATGLLNKASEVMRSSKAAATMAAK